jgi:PhnB protein
MQVQPYLFFDGRCEEAIEFYKRALGATDAQVMRYKDSPEPDHGMVPPGAGNKVMHARFRIGNTEVMASDGHCGGNPSFKASRCRPMRRRSGCSRRWPRVARCRWR